MSTITEILNQDIFIKNLWMIKCSAIWLSKPVLTSKGLTGRIAIGDGVNTADGVLCSDGDTFSQEVVYTKTNVTNSRMEIVLKSFSDGAITTILLMN